MSTQPTVVVTGASTGIGRATVQLLADRDVRVVAAVRDLDTVPDHPLVTGVRLDVTEAERVSSAAADVGDLVGDAGLHGLVNNAGVAVAGPLEHLALDDLRRQLEVNVIGQVAVTQAFLPLLRRRGRGARVVFTGSISGRVGLPFAGPYAASKHALHGLAESWRRELRPFGIGVSVLAPGAVSTPIWAKAEADVDQVIAGLPPEGRERYAEAIDGMRTYVAGADGAGIAPEVVARAAHHALFSRRPRAEYLLGVDARAISGASTLLPSGLMDRLVERGMRS